MRYKRDIYDRSNDLIEGIQALRLKLELEIIGLKEKRLFFNNTKGSIVSPIDIYSETIESLTSVVDELNALVEKANDWDIYE